MFSLQSVIRLSLSCSLGLGLLLLLSFIYSSPLQTQPQLVIHRRLEGIPDGYVQAGIANSSETIRLTIGLQSLNMTGLQTRLYEVSTPNNPLYGQHLTKAETEDHVRPHFNVTNGLNQWLSVNGIAPKASSPAGNHISLEVTIGQAQRLLRTQFYVYNHTATNQSIIRTDQYSVPESMNATITFIHPTVHFPLKPKTSLGRMTVPPAASTPLNATIPRGNCNFQEVSISCLMELYGIPGNLGVPPNNAHAGIIALNEQSLQADQLAVFLSQWRADVNLASIRADIVSVRGGDNTQSSTADNGEANVDVQMLLGLMPSSQVTVFPVKPNDSGTDMLDAMDALLGQEEGEMPTVFSISYGNSEADLPTELAQFTCNAMMQYGTRGGTVIVSSGDGGVSGGQAESCTKFNPAFPASCPWVLSVGAVDGTSGALVAAPFTSGGFSNIFGREAYQHNAVEGYLNQLGDENKGLFNPDGRGFPDMTLVGTNIIMQNNSLLATIDGTSTTAPMAAAMISGINQLRADQGKPPVGFVNPALYVVTSAFTDITQGSNPGCNTTGFPATSGWDPITGLGLPNFQQLVSSL